MRVHENNGVQAVRKFRAGGWRLQAWNCHSLQRSSSVKLLDIWRESSLCFVAPGSCKITRFYAGCSTVALPDSLTLPLPCPSAHIPFNASIATVTGTYGHLNNFFLSLLAQTLSPSKIFSEPPAPSAHKPSGLIVSVVGIKSVPATQELHFFTATSCAKAAAA